MRSAASPPLLLSGSRDGSVRSWAADGSCLAVLRLRGEVLRCAPVPAHPWLGLAASSAEMLVFRVDGLATADAMRTAELAEPLPMGEEPPASEAAGTRPLVQALLHELADISLASHAGGARLLYGTHQGELGLGMLCNLPDASF